MKSCKREQLQFCLIIKSLSPDFRTPIGVPVLTYKVYVDDAAKNLCAEPPRAPFRYVRCARSRPSVRYFRREPPVGSADVPNRQCRWRLGAARGGWTQTTSGDPAKPALLTHPYFSRTDFSEDAMESASGRSMSNRSSELSNTISIRVFPFRSPDKYSPVSVTVAARMSYSNHS